MSNAFSNTFGILGAALFGAVFAVLFDSSKAIAARTYLAEDDARYLQRIVLGVLSGFILAKYIDVPGENGVFPAQLLALLGGFSAQAVHTILSHLVSALQAAFTEKPEDVIEREVRTTLREAEASNREVRLRIDAELAQLEGIAPALAPNIDQIRRRLRDY